MNVENLSGCTALVTGAASGIGRATALELAGRGADLVLCDVDEEGLSETASRAEAQVHGLGLRVVSSVVDVSRAEEMRAFADRVHADIDCVDLLVNNAGVGLGARFLDTPLGDWDWIVGINLMGVVYGCHFFVPPAVARGRGGHVVNVSSSAGFFASQALAAYSTTKFAVLGLSEALRDELTPHGIGVTAACPGVIDTTITRNTRLRGEDASPRARQEMIDAFARRHYTPERVARNLMKAVQRNRGVAPISPEAWALYALKRISPRITCELAGWVDRLRRSQSPANEG